METLSFNAMLDEIVQHLLVGNHADVSFTFHTHEYHTPDFQEAVHLSLYDRVPKRPLDMDQIDAIKPVSFEHIRFSKVCPICLDDFAPSDDMLEIDHCHHVYHVACLRQSVQNGFDTCAVCAVKLIPEPEERCRRKRPRRARGHTSTSS